MTTVIEKAKGLNWISVLAPLPVILMETFWVYPWLAWAGQLPAFTEPRPVLGLLSVFLIFAISFFLTRYLLARHLSLGVTQLTILATGVFVTLLVMRLEYPAGLGLFDGQWFVATGWIFLDSFSHPQPVVVAPLAGAYLWWRGISRARSQLDFDSLYRSFLVGLFALIIFIIVWGASKGSSMVDLTSRVGGSVAAFFFFGLTALALVNLETIRERAGSNASRIFSRRWLLIILGIIGGIILIGAGIATTFSTNLVTVLGQFLNSASDLFFKALYYILLPIGFLLEVIIWVGRFLINLVTHGQTTPLPNLGETPEIENLPEKVARSLSPELLTALKWTFFAAVLAFILFLLARAIVRFAFSREKDEAEEVNESLFTWGGLRADLRLMLAAVWQRFRRQRKPKHSESSNLESDPSRRLSIREIYQLIMMKAAGFGLEHRREETPYEYERRLAHALPDASAPLTELTEYYVAVRYGESQFGEKQIEQANSLWRTLRDIFARSFGEDDGRSIGPASSSGPGSPPS